MIELAQKISGCVRGEVVGCRAAEHRDKENGIDKARGEDRQVANTCGDAHQDSRADYAREGARRVYKAFCRELAGAILDEPSCCTHRVPTYSLIPVPARRLSSTPLRIGARKQPYGPMQQNLAGAIVSNPLVALLERNSAITI